MEAVRAQVGADLLVGLSTHSPEQLERALGRGGGPAERGPRVGDAHQAGPPAAGLEYVRHAAGRAGERPWFAIGGIDLDNVRQVTAAGAERIVVVRAIRDAADPAAAAAALRAALDAPGGRWLSGRAASAASAARSSPPPPRRPWTWPSSLERGYSRSRRRDEEARAALVPLAPGERPLAVTVAAVVAAVLGVANLVALIVSYDPDEGGKTASTLLGTVVLARAGGGDVARPLLGGARLPGAARDHDRARLPGPAHSRERGRGGARRRDHRARRARSSGSS